MNGGSAIWGLRLLALGLALSAWFFVTQDKREESTETSIDASVRYTTPRDHTVLNPVETVRVRVSGPASTIANLNPFTVSVLVDLRNADKGTQEVPLSAGDVTLPTGLLVVSLEPNLLPLELDRVVTEMRPVVPSLTGEPAAGAVVNNPAVVPDRVLVSGPETRLRLLETLSTAEVSLDGHAITFSESAMVVSPDNLIRVLQPIVTVKVPMEIPNVPDAEPSSPAP